MNKFLAVPLAFLAFITGIGISTLLWNTHTDSEIFEVNVEGNFGAAVTVTTTGAFTSQTQQVRDLIDGEGRIIQEHGQVLVRTTKFSATGGKWSQVDGQPGIVSGLAEKSSVGRLANVVIGKREGSRVAIIDPQDGDVSVMVVDILPTRVSYSAQQQSSDPLIPSVSSDEDGVPSLGTITAPIDNVRISSVITGDGAQVTQQDVVYANYVLAHVDGSQMENTFSNGNPPAYIAVEDVFPGLHAGLIDQRVGSRVVISVPAAQAQGEEDVLIVLDILAISDEKPHVKTVSI
ncbi:FKBP-type peptidyl-prolyl cis-trans isomerase [Arcanobacterium pinnipediorum]|uniref:peptidylprolyl isomerase n=1 Tax=Arcanobacterium pinnipediorum TaxID=1503041 RepID=A0ABY5AF97_9ACTO|nr:hypothetical protein [Arcanobacterium pinnipediorum]USR78666.1 hypothetical protein NG665_04535 [Arcanobacterium pinnipediorum]